MEEIYIIGGSVIYYIHIGRKLFIFGESFISCEVASYLGRKLNILGGSFIYLEEALYIGRKLYILGVTRGVLVPLISGIV